MWSKETEKERQRERKRDRERETEKERQRERDRDRERERKRKRKSARAREREGATVMHPLWNHCNQGNDKCREKAERAGERRNRGDEESRGTAASADQLWMAWSPQRCHNSPHSVHSQNINTHFHTASRRDSVVHSYEFFYFELRDRHFLIVSDLEAYRSLFRNTYVDNRLFELDV